jgi:energy-coupling factor transporter ATP-binding protein EcfA2
LNCPDYINLKLKVSEWKTAINQSIEDYDLKNILSEWEQKSIAIAEFITELRISNDNNPVIFDDPVNSLDHHRLERVARRLFKLSLERQVIVFTHNIILFYTFEQIKDEYKLMNKKIDSIIYSVEKQENKCWKLNKDKWPSNTTFESYVSKTEKLIKKSINTNESEIVEKWYWYLRAMIELLIEDWIFKKTVKRYKKNVSTTNLLRVRWDLLDWNKEKIIEIFWRCSWYMWWHSWPEEINNTPNLSELKADFQNIKSIWNDFNKKE